MAVKALADQQIQGRASIVAVGGSDNPFQPFGTDPIAIAEAIQSVYSDDGVLVLMDLGSAVISGQVALDLLDPAQRVHVRLSSGPFVEGAMAAAVQASIGMSLDAVAREAEEAMQAKAVVLHDWDEAALDFHPASLLDVKGDPAKHTASADVIVVNPAGLHFGPAARFIQAAAQFHAEVHVTNLTTGAGPAPASRFNRLLSLGIEKDHCIRIEAMGPDADEVVDLLVKQITHDIGGAGEEKLPIFGVDIPPIEGNGAARLHGLPASPGVAIGVAFVWQRPQDFISLPNDLATGMAGNPAYEWERFTQSQKSALAQIDGLVEQVRATMGEDQAVIFRAHALLLQDRDFLDEVRTAIDSGQRAEIAVRQTVLQAISRFRQMSGSVFQQRAADLEDVGSRLLRLLGEQTPPTYEFPENAILIADDLLPSQTAMLDRSRVLGICTSSGGPTSHSVILARSMGIPAVVGIGSMLLELVTPGATVALDGANGVVIVEPDAATVELFTVAQRKANAVRAEAWLRAQQLTRTQDGVRIEVAANLGSASDLAMALEAGAEAVGLLRTEFLFQDRSTAPDEEEQTAIYSQVAGGLGARRLVIRTLDIGGDKPAPYLQLPTELNPFLGWRAIRISLAMPDFFKIQLRALMRSAAVADNLHIMFPMISTIDELLRVQALMAAAASELAATGLPFRADVPFGVMIETPAAVEMAEQLAQLVDFFSIGTNDLTQYTFAADRSNERVAGLHDPLHPALLRQIDRTLRAAHAHGRWVGLCGEMAADPLAIPILLGLGLDEFSMAPSRVPLAKQTIAQLTMPAARRLAQKALQCHDGASVRKLVRDTMEGMNVL